MRKLTLILVILGLATGKSLAADSTAVNAWKTQVEAGLALTQASYSDNWTGGEVGSLIWVANLHAIAEKQLTGKLRTENDLKLAFGQTHSQSQVSKQWASPQKSTDKIRFDTVEKFTLKTWVDPYIAGTFESQFYDASDSLKARYVNPIDLTESAGMSRLLFDKPTGKASTRVGFGLRQRIAKYSVDALGTTDTKTTNDGGIEWVTDWNTRLSETMTYTTKLTVFKALIYSEKDALAGLPNENYWKATDLNWDNILTANVTKIVQVNLAWQLLYDKEIDLGGRFKETLALGVSWKI